MIPELKRGIFSDRLKLPPDRETINIADEVIFTRRDLAISLASSGACSLIWLLAADKAQKLFSQIHPIYNFIK